MASASNGDGVLDRSCSRFFCRAEEITYTLSTPSNIQLLESSSETLELRPPPVRPLNCELVSRRYVLDLEKPQSRA